VKLFFKMSAAEHIYRSHNFGLSSMYYIVTVLAEPEKRKRHVGGVDGIPHRLRHPGQDIGHSQEIDQGGVLHVGHVVGRLVTH
jgi:hypothetical protein